MTFTAYATITMPISVKIEAENEQQAFAIAQYKLFDRSIDGVNLSLVRADEKLEPKVLDWDITVAAEDIFEEQS